MSKNAPQRFPLAGTAGDDLFTRQRDEYSCGPASVTTVCRLLGADGDYESIRNALTPSPETGTPPEAIAELSRRILPCEGAGNRAWAGGIAIANVMLDGEGHYVVFLAREKDDVLYYDPYHHEFVLDGINNIEWSKGDGDRDQWAANFTTPEGNSIAGWLKYAEPKAPSPAPHVPPPRLFPRGPAP